MREEKRTLECLKKAARIASQCMDTGVQVQICVELLNHYLFYFERGNALITVALLNQVSSPAIICGFKHEFNREFFFLHQLTVDCQDR